MEEEQLSSFTEYDENIVFIIGAKNGWQSCADFCRKAMILTDMKELSNLCSSAMNGKYKEY